MTVEGVEQVEGWGFVNGTIIRPPEALEEGSEVSAEEGTRFTILGAPHDTQLIEPTVSEGRWYQPGDSDVVVLSQEVINKEPYIKVGDVLKVKINDKTRKVTVIGIVNVVGMTYAYAPFDYVTRLQGTPGRSFVSLIGTTSRKAKEQEKVARAVEEHYQQIGIGVEQAITIASLIGMITGMIDFFLYFMVLMAVLLGIVGGLGLASTMSLNVLERTREIGVMRAIGASGRSMRGIFLSEGLLIALISYVISCVISLPASYGFAYFAGNAFFDRPLNLILDPMGYALWLAVACLLAAVASLMPARRAARISVREALAYE
jgi:putative ABC transport system permease protein